MLLLYGFGGAAGAGLTLSQQVAYEVLYVWFYYRSWFFTGNLLAGRSFKDLQKLL